MAGGQVANLRRVRRAVIHWMIAAFILPVLFGLLPQSAPSPARALERDLTLSVCSPFGQQDPTRGPLHDESKATCVLCIIGCGFAGPDGPQDGFAANANPEDFAKAFMPILLGVHGVRAVLADASPPRGPPVQIS